MSDPAEFSHAWAGVAPALAAWCRLQVRGPLARAMDADDLLQEVCFQAYRGFERYDPDLRPFRPWIFGVASNVLKMMLRGLARAHRNLGAVEPLASRAGSVPEEATTVSRRVARDEGLSRFVDRVNELDEDDRQLLLWRGLEGLTHAEVGELLGVHEDAARKRWLRLRERLARLPAAALLAVD